MKTICDTCVKAAVCKDEPYLGAWCADWVYENKEQQYK